MYVFSLSPSHRARILYSQGGADLETNRHILREGLLQAAQSNAAMSKTPLDVRFDSPVNDIRRDHLGSAELLGEGDELLVSHTLCYI